MKVLKPLFVMMAFVLFFFLAISYMFCAPFFLVNCAFPSGWAWWVGQAVAFIGFCALMAYTRPVMEFFTKHMMEEK